MEERRASLVAVGVSSIAIGGFWMARPNVARSGLRVLEQRNLPLAGIGIDRDAAVLFRVAVPGSYHEHDKTVQFRIVDAKDHVYPLAPMNDPAFLDTLKLQRGYVHRADNPRLVAVSGSEVLGSVPVGDLPEPVSEPLDPKPSPFVSLVLHDGWVDIRPRARIPRNERWRIDVRRTQSGPVSEVWTILPSRGFRSPFPGLSIPFASDAKAVELQITRYRLEEFRGTVDVPGFRLHQHQGGVGIAVNEPQERTARLGPLIASVTVPQQDTGPYRANSAHPPPIGRASLSVDFGENPNTATDGRRELPTAVRTSVELLSPRPNSLGLSELRLGPAFCRSDPPPNGPMKAGPFAIRLLLTAWKPRPIARFTTVVPVEVESTPLGGAGRLSLGRLEPR